jgi:NIMA-interacting peptidyl-prolyl cis-trans isomerase 1
MADALVDVAAIADAVEAVEAAASSGNANEDQRSQDPPPPLPRGWIMKDSRSGPGYHYFYNMDTGMSTWDPPVDNTIENAEEVADRLMGVVGGAGGSTTSSSQPPPSRKQKDDAAVNEERREPKRQRKEEPSSLPSSSSSPKEVRVFHILKKHRGSKRPASWRNPKITQTKEEAHEELEGLLEILEDEEGDLKELRATFEELARTESDCSSAKRGGDLGFFGRRKMQPAFEEASFRLKVGEMTKKIVDTKSGSHILLRIG